MRLVGGYVPDFQMSVDPGRTVCGGGAQTIGSDSHGNPRRAAAA